MNSQQAIEIVYMVEGLQVWKQKRFCFLQLVQVFIGSYLSAHEFEVMASKGIWFCRETSVFFQSL